MSQSRCFLFQLCGIVGAMYLLTFAVPGQAQERAQEIPNAEEVAELLEREPLTLQNWPAWRRRLLAWIEDRGEGTTPAYLAAWAFFKEQAKPAGELPPALATDAFAWYLLGSAYLNDAFQQDADTRSELDHAEKALRRSLQLDPKSARAHARLALVLMRHPDARKSTGDWNREQLANARKELDEARRLQPGLRYLHAFEGELALAQDRPSQAEQLFSQALREEPNQVGFALGAARAVIMNKDIKAGTRATRLEPLVDQFPDSGPLACLYALTLAMDDRAGAAGGELQRARKLGTDPAKVLPPELVQRIDKDARPWLLLSTFGWTMLGFAVFYAVVMALMAGFGLLLAGRTRGSRALELLGTAPDELVSEGQVARTRSESLLAKLYALALVVGLILFYTAVPFLIAGLLATTAALLYGIFQLPRIPIKLVVIVVVVGLGMVWAVFRSLFVRPGTGSFGVVKTAADCPRLYQALTDVARRVDTEPVHEVYVAPGSSIGVHQEGRGPFGVFGVKSRVLTLGLSTMHFLTVAELQSILAHEYAHFSHRDTFYSRFIYQVTLAIQQALHGMGQSGGRLNYVNPFFWFLYLYYKAYSLLSAGFSRSREFLADRMASSLYGSNVFTSALTKVSTEGTLFEMTIYDNIAKLLEQNKSFVNMYASFRDFRDQQLQVKEREELYQKLLEEKESAFADHPTFRERIEAVAPLPASTQADATSALQLFEEPDKIEQELTDYLTGYMFHLRQLQEQAARQTA